MEVLFRVKNWTTCSIRIHNLNFRRKGSIVNGGEPGWLHFTPVIVIADRNYVFKGVLPLLGQSTSE